MVSLVYVTICWVFNQEEENELKMTNHLRFAFLFAIFKKNRKVSESA